MNKNEKKFTRQYKGVLISETTPFAYEEAFNTLRTNILFCANNEKCPVFGITSPLANSGKSVITSNLSLVFSNLGKKVLLIDCDLRNHTIDKIFDLNVESGLSRFLSQADVSLSESLVKDVRPGLDVLPCGKIPPNPAELLSSAKMKQLLDMARETYDYIFLDFPPILEVSDAATLSQSVTGYVMLARAGVTDTGALKKAVSAIEMLGAKIVGVVINGSNLKNGYYYKKSYRRYGYGYGYGYGKKQD